MGILAANASVQKTHGKQFADFLLPIRTLFAQMMERNEVQFLSGAGSSIPLLNSWRIRRKATLCRSPLWRQSRHDCVEVDRPSQARGRTSPIGSTRAGPGLPLRTGGHQAARDPDGRTKEAGDAVIIGYGWTGAIMAKTLTDAGLSVVALERGPARGHLTLTSSIPASPMN